MLKLSVVIPTLNRADLLSVTIDRISNQTVPRDAYEIVVVDNGSTDHTRTVLDQKSRLYTNLRHFSQLKRGAAATRNVGIGNARGEIILFIDDDILAEKHLAESHLNYHRQYERASIIGGVTTPWTSSKDPFLRYLRDRRIFNPYSITGGPIDFSYYHTGNVSTARTHLKEAGGFNEEFFIYGMEDIELGYRLEKLGCKMIHAPDAGAEHQYFPNYQQFTLRCEQAGYSLGKLIELHPELKSRFVENGKRTRLLKQFHILYKMFTFTCQPLSRLVTRWEEKEARGPLHPSWIATTIGLCATISSSGIVNTIATASMATTPNAIPNMSIRPAQSPPVTFLGEFSKKLVTNTFFNILGRAWSFLVTILLTPYLLRHLDKGEFGAWILLSIFTTSFNLLDLGLGSSFIKYISAYYTYEDYDHINEVIFSGLAFYGLFGLVLTLGGLAIEKPLFAYFNLTAVSSLFPIVLVACSLQNVALLFLSVFKGIQRMDISNSIEIRMSIVNVIGTVLFLEGGLGVFGLAVNSVVTQLIAVVWTWWTIRQFMPKVRLGWHFNPLLLKEMFSYGAKIQVSQVGNLVCFNVDKLIISRFLGVASVSFYEVGSRLTSFMRAVPLVMLSAIIPATSELRARNDREKIRQTYYVASKYVCMMTVALVGFVILEARSAVNFWIGSGFENSVILIQILAIGYGVNVMGGAASQTGAGVGRPEFDMKSTVLLTVLNPILSLILVRRFGAAGAAAGTSVALAVAAVYLLVIFHRQYLENSVWTIFRDIQLRPIVAASIATLAVAGFHVVVPQIVQAERLRYLIPIKIAVDLSLFGAFYMALLVALRQINAMDRNNFLGLVSFGFEFLRHPLRERVKIYR